VRVGRLWLLFEFLMLRSYLKTGSKSHKLVKSDVSRILSLYYTDSVSFAWCFHWLCFEVDPIFQRVLFLICAGNELFFVSLYLMRWVHTPIGLDSYPILAQLTYPHAMALFSFPICFTKNVINVVQLWKASKILVGVDLATRADARAAVRHDRDTSNGRE
jgi:CDP-diacylglycerol--inositol 3-phosphatidyltransferase